VVDARSISATTSVPRIDQVIDLGTGAVPREGPLRNVRGDGSAVIGELLLIEGSNFGRQPTVTIGGNATQALARTRGGGVVVRVPWGIDPGQVEVEISHAGGRHVVPLPVKRLGLVAGERTLRAIELRADGSLSVGAEVALDGQPRQIAMSADGSVAYVGGERQARAHLWIVDLAASPAPRVASQRPLPGSRVVGVASAEQAPFGAIVTDSHVVYLDSPDPLHPAFYTPHAIPPSVTQRQIIAAAISGRGKALALLLADLNRVAVFAIGNPTVLDTPQVVEVLPGSRLQTVQDLRFSTDGASLWVASGDNARTIASGFQPTQLTLLQLFGDPVIDAKVRRTWEIGEKAAPLRIAVARGEPIPPGTAIRAEPSTSAVYVAVVSSELLRAGLPRFAAQPAAGAVLRSSLGKGGERMLSGPRLVTSVDVAGKTQVVVALAIEGEGGGARRVLIGRRAWTGGREHVAPLDGFSLASIKSSLWIGEVRLQP
jgi:hypothetical protein